MTKNQKLHDDVDLHTIADKTHGYVGADLKSLTMKAAIGTIRRCAVGIVDLNAEDISAEFMDSLRVTMYDFNEALKVTGTSITRDVVVETPQVTFEDIGGLEDVKQELQEMIMHPVQWSEMYEQQNMEAPKGVLLYGPPGCGKTLMAKAMANQCEANFISIKGPQLLTKWFGESEGNVREMFEKARQSAPCVIFFDELDSIAKARGGSHDGGGSDRVVNAMLVEMDGMQKRSDVFVVGATNRPLLLDTAIMRTGRLDQLIYIPMPDAEARYSVLKARLRKSKVDERIDLRKIAYSMEGYSGADLAGMCQMAVKINVRRRIAVMESTMAKVQADYEAENPDGKPLTREEIKAKALEITGDNFPITLSDMLRAKKATRRSISGSELAKYRLMKTNLQAQLGMQENNAGLTVGGQLTTEELREFEKAYAAEEVDDGDDPYADE